MTETQATQGYFSPGEVAAPQPMGQRQAAAAAAAHASKSGSRSVIIVVLIGILVLGASAAVYFLVLKKSGGVSGPQATVQAYFDALSGGDTKAALANVAPENQPTGLELQMMETMFSMGTFEFKDVELKTVSESATNAQVEIVRVTVSAMGQSVTVNAGDLGLASGTVFTLEMRNGKWVITDAGSGSVPSLPGTTVPAPTSG